jgi:hypothetical protein
MRRLEGTAASCSSGDNAKIMPLTEMGDFYYISRVLSITRPGECPTEDDATLQSDNRRGCVTTDGVLKISGRIGADGEGKGEDG